jgi:hypothetical protein
MVGASSLSYVSVMEATQSSDRNINDGDLHPRSPTSAVTSQRGSISSNDRSRYAERTKGAATQCFLYVIACVATRTFTYIVVLIEMFGGTCPWYLLFIENLLLPLQGFANVFIFLRPRIQSIQKSNPEMFYLTAAFHSVFHYDEVHQRLTESVISPVRPDEGSRSKRGTTSTPDSMGDKSDALKKTATDGTNEKEESVEPGIHDGTPAHHDADKEPTIAETASFTQSTGPKRANMAKRVSFHGEAENVK